MLNFYRRFFADEIDGHAAFARIVQAQLPEAGQVLDLGCGDNANLAPFRTSQRAIWGVDYQQHPELHDAGWFRLLEHDGRIPFPDCTFDVITSRWVLEHVEQPVIFLQEVQRVLRPGGLFISLSIHGWHYVTWITRLIHLLPHALTQSLVFRLYGRAHHDTFPTHYRLNTTRQLRRAGQAAGLYLAQLTRIANPCYFSFCPPLERLAIVTDWLLEEICPGLGRIYFIATLRKGEQAAAEMPLRKTA